MGCDIVGGARLVGAAAAVIGHDGASEGQDVAETELREVQRLQGAKLVLGPIQVLLVTVAILGVASLVLTRRTEANCRECVWSFTPANIRRYHLPSLLLPSLLFP